MSPMPANARRAIALAIPLLTIALLWGIVEAMFGINMHENLANTGVTLSGVFGGLNLVVWWLVFKHRIP